MVISDPPDQYLSVNWGGENFFVGGFGHSLRMRLYRDYLGLSEEENELIVDPVGDEGKKIRNMYRVIFCVCICLLIGEFL